MPSSKSTARGDDLSQVRELLSWARREKWALSLVTVGGVTVHVAADLSFAPSAPSLASDRPAEDPYETYGGPALRRFREQQAAAQSQADATVEDEDE